MEKGGLKVYGGNYGNCHNVMFYTISVFPETIRMKQTQIVTIFPVLCLCTKLQLISTSWR